MSHYFDKGFVVREPAWHGLAEVLEDYPGREKAMKIAGHDFNILELPVHSTIAGKKQQVEGWKIIARDDTNKILSIRRDAYQVIPNSTMWDIVDELMGQNNVKYETAGVLKHGAILWVLARIDEPVKIKGDDSETFPFCLVATSHDGSRSCSAAATSVRVVCWNTFTAAEAETQRSGMVYSFRHIGNIKERVEEAKVALKLTREKHKAFIGLSKELAKHKVTEDGVKDFVTQLIPDLPANLVTEKGTQRIEVARAKVFDILESRSIPEAHKRTSYGMFCAGIEYIDHVHKNWRSAENYFKRTVYKQNKLKPQVVKLALSVAAG